MLFVARFTDQPDIAERRAELLESHFDWLAANDDKVLLAGSLRSDVGGDSLGGLWIIDADSKAAAEQVYQTDPFFANGLRAKVDLFHYVKAHPNKTAVIKDTGA
ncbi:MAG TPA: YciI family protein [Gammaproteobacteria bacterium]|nr:YciI family protein [Gammaproteobacteria bacterium]